MDNARVNFSWPVGETDMGKAVMSQSLKEQIMALLQGWRNYALPISTFRGTTDDYERGYRTGFAKALTACADELNQLLARHSNSLSDQ